MWHQQNKGIHSDPTMVLKNAPVPVYFAGWQSDTATLGRHGWEMAVSQDQMMFRMMVMFYHPGLRLSGITRDGFDMKMDGPITIHQVAPAEHITVQLRGEMDMSWVDTQPSYEQRTGTMADLELFNLKPMHDAPTVPTVFIEEANMEAVDHLQAILDGQKDKQRELRDKHKASQDRADATTSKIIQQIIQV